jgi:hypothetical protein
MVLGESVILGGAEPEVRRRRSVHRPEQKQRLLTKTGRFR